MSAARSLYESQPEQAVDVASEIRNRINLACLVAEDLAAEGHPYARDLNSSLEAVLDMVKHLEGAKS